jgi:hypothetical protein
MGRALLVALLLAVCGAFPRHALASPPPLFTLGIAGGIAGATMTATVYGDGTVVIDRTGAGSTPHTTLTVPVETAAVKAAVALARARGVFAIPHKAQDAVIGADIPVRSLTVYTAHGTQSVHAMGGPSTHAPRTAGFFAVWGLFYALAGYPAQIARTP